MKIDRRKKLKLSISPKIMSNYDIELIIKNEKEKSVLFYLDRKISHKNKAIQRKGKK